MDFWNNSHLQKNLFWGICCICHSVKQTDTNYIMMCLDVAEHSIGSHWMGWEKSTWCDGSMNPFAYMPQLWSCWSTGCMRRTNIYEYVKRQNVWTPGWVWKEIRFCGFSHKEIFPQKVSLLGQAAFLIRDSHGGTGSLMNTRKLSNCFFSLTCKWCPLQITVQCRQERPITILSWR